MANPSVNQILEALRNIGVEPFIFEESDGNICIGTGLRYRQSGCDEDDEESFQDEDTPLEKIPNEVGDEHV